MPEEKKEHKDSPLRDAEDSVDDPTLINTVEGRLKNMRNMLNDVEEPAEPEPEPVESILEEQPAEEPESEPEPNPDAENDDVEKKGSKDKEDPPEAADIPDGHIRAAKGQGWSDEDIAAEVEADPDRARRLFQNAYETANKITRQFSAIGRAQANATRKATEEPAPEIKDFITADEITKITDGDEPTAAVLRAMNQRIREQATENAKRSTVSASNAEFAKSDQVAATARANTTADANAMQAVNEFFDAGDMESYADFYGVVDTHQDWDDITPRQKGHRIEVLQIADQLKVGKASQSIEISTVQALSDAHLLVTESIRETNTISKIKKSLKKRTKTLRPSDSKRSATSVAGRTKAKNRDEAVANAERDLAALRKKGW